MIRLASGLFVVLLSSAGAAQAVASALPPSSSVATCIDAGPVVLEDNPCSTGGAASSAVGAPFATAMASATGGVGSNAGATAALTYAFRIDGPDNGPISIGIATNLLTTASPYASAFASISTLRGSEVCADTNENECGRSQFDGAFYEMDEPGQVYTVHLEVVAAEDGQFGGTAFASADPFIFVNPGDAGAAGYSIEVSPDVVNGLPSGVPEPAAWLVMLLGGGVIGARLRGARRRNLTV